MTKHILSNPADIFSFSCKPQPIEFVFEQIQDFSYEFSDHICVFLAFGTTYKNVEKDRFVEPFVQALQVCALKPYNAEQIEESDTTQSTDRLRKLAALFGLTPDIKKDGVGQAKRNTRSRTKKATINSTNSKSSNTVTDPSSESIGGVNSKESLYALITELTSPPLHSSENDLQFFNETLNSVFALLHHKPYLIPYFIETWLSLVYSSKNFFEFMEFFGQSWYHSFNPKVKFFLVTDCTLLPTNIKDKMKQSIGSDYKKIWVHDVDEPYTQVLIKEGFDKIFQKADTSIGGVNTKSEVASRLYVFDVTNRQLISGFRKPGRKVKITPTKLIRDKLKDILVSFTDS